MGNEASSQYGKKIENNIVIKWRKSSDCPFPARDGQAAAVLNSKLYIFGGVIFSKDGGEDGNGQDVETNDLLVYDCKTEKWSKEDCKGDIPHPRSGSCLVAVGSCLYLFGGLSQLSGWLNDLHVYDTNTNIWKVIECNNPPSPRDKVTSVAVGEKLYVFGGFGPVAEEELIDVNEPLPSDDSDGYEDMDDEIIGIGNQNAANFTWFNDLFVFDTTKKVWSIVFPSNQTRPSPRAAHSFNHLKDKDNKEWLFVFGGKDSIARQNDLWRFNLSSFAWEQCESKGCQPEPRSFHASCAVNHRLVVCGGRGLVNQHFNDLHIFDTDTLQWLQPQLCDDSIPPPALGLHTLCVIENEMVLFGGSSEIDPATGTCTKFYNDLYKVQTDDIMTGDAIQEKTPEEQSETLPAVLNLKPTKSEQTSTTS